MDKKIKIMVAIVLKANKYVNMYWNPFKLILIIKLYFMIYLHNIQI